MHRLRCVRVEFVCGIATGVTVEVTRSPSEYRRAQRNVAAGVEARDPWQVVVPELYAEPPAADRRHHDVRLRTWDEESVGTTRLPVGFLRFHDRQGLDLGRLGEAHWRVRSRHVTLFADGAGVVTLSVDVAFGGDTPLGEVRREVDRGALGPLSELAEAISRERAQELAVALRRAGQDPPAEEVRIVGRHRLIVVEEPPEAALVAALGSEVCLLGSGDEFRDVCAEADRFCFPGNGISVEVTADPGPSVLRPVLEYYEYWIAATTSMDDRLHDEVTLLTEAEAPSGTEAILKDQARGMWLAHRDVLNALSPRDVAAWEGFARTWRIEEVERDLMHKIDAVEELNRSIREALANKIAERTNALVTFLTALTLISIVTGIAAFVLSESRLTYPARVWLVVVSFLAAVALFAVSVRPVVLQRARDRRG